MALIIAGNFYPLNMASVNLAGMLNGTITVSSPSTVAVSYSNGVSDVFYGDFSYSGSIPVSGYITSYSIVWAGQTMMSMTDFSLSVPDFMGFTYNNDNIGLIAFTLSGPDAIIGSRYSDFLLGAAGDDTIFGGGGNDSILGGDGTDTVVFAGRREQYTITPGATAGTHFVAGSEGTTSLLNVERLVFAQGGWADISALVGASPANAIYRFYNDATGTHFYTASVAERNAVLNTAPTMHFEGVAFGSTGAAGQSVWRFYNERTGTHFYTISEAERDQIQATLPQMHFEGEAYKASVTQAAGLDPLYRFYNTQTGAHFYTANTVERDVVLTGMPQFKYEGIAYYVDL